MNEYIQAVIDLATQFTFELCEFCHEDLDKHIISPDMFGKPHAWCTTEKIPS